MWARRVAQNLIFNELLVMLNTTEEKGNIYAQKLEHHVSERSFWHKLRPQ